MSRPTPPGSQGSEQKEETRETEEKNKPPPPPPGGIQIQLAPLDPPIRWPVEYPAFWEVDRLTGQIQPLAPRPRTDAHQRPQPDQDIRPTADENDPAQPR